MQRAGGYNENQFRQFYRQAARGPVARSVIAGCVFAGVAMTLAPLSAHAQNAPIVTKDRPFDAYPSTYSSNPIRSWLDMVSASQAAQPRTTAIIL